MPIFAKMSGMSARLGTDAFPRIQPIAPAGGNRRRQLTHRSEYTAPISSIEFTFGRISPPVIFAALTIRSFLPRRMLYSYPFILPAGQQKSDLIHY